YTNSSAVYYKGLVWLGISGSEGITPGLEAVTPALGLGNRAGGFAIVDAANGNLLVRTRTVPEEEFAVRGDGGGSIWSTMAVDDDGFGYAGTGQPSPWIGSIQSDYTNAIVKIDMERERDGAANENFGKIVGVFRGTPDLGRDVDFAGSPTLYEVEGVQMAAAIQKSGVLHAGSTGDMVHVWEFPLSAVASPLYNFCSVANDGKNIYGVGAIPGQIWSIDAASGGRPNWVQRVDTELAANPVAVANGVVYHNDQGGNLNAFDAATGATLLLRDMSADVGTECTNVGGGLAIARNTIYSVCGERGGDGIGPSDQPSGWVIAYRPQ
ncbi:MAG: PQQ-binding-like beta-propeller repeat protein, partial [Candidatus Binatia bacterium]